MPDWLWAAFAFVLIVEGILPFASPRLWRETFRRLIDLSDGQIRFVGLTALVVGIAVLTLTGHA
ncbi:MAG: DUF2065 family protein [Burkholderiales bacterium]|nr:DUF2065 family protein [Burkholderiales bacterium]GIK87901.1 MAG: hypothetical protein BroJett026_33820 [Betaproteobacteria bacterium]